MMKSVFVALTFAAITLGGHWSRPVQSAETFPTADELALRILDSEALYTVSSGIKPVSEGFWNTQFPSAELPSGLLDHVSKTLSALPLGPDFETGVLVFRESRENTRHASAFIAHRPSLQRIIQRRSDAFAPLGISPQLSAQEVMTRIDAAEGAARWRAFGLVFGYPDYAVEFFVHAGEHERQTKQFVKREFLNLPTFVSERGRFVYAVPLGHQLRSEDLLLRGKVEPTLCRYKIWRDAYLCTNGCNALALLADWRRSEDRAICCQVHTSSNSGCSIIHRQRPQLASCNQFRNRRGLIRR